MHEGISTFSTTSSHALDHLWPELLPSLMKPRPVDTLGHLEHR